MSILRDGALAAGVDMLPGLAVSGYEIKRSCASSELDASSGITALLSDGSRLEADMLKIPKNPKSKNYKKSKKYKI